MKTHGFTQDEKGDSPKEANEMTAFELEERDCYFLHPEEFYPSAMSNIYKSKISPYIRFEAYGKEFKYHAVTIRQTPGMFSFNFCELHRQAVQKAKTRIKFHKDQIKELQKWAKR